ncbi:hypothetical protein A9Q84_02660 [Halobacteriovorax marinus]|mgnify:CR=1 FL=1|uniref:Uncharacterized protein n=1 Tax=Halobacteriovorax marinus TaxID=97084 RepID=A0A1Y5FD45_9BACT|nr:hypothetical protein A9Q84_02660 [Halobacteriovorax marinus]
MKNLLLSIILFSISSLSSAYTVESSWNDKYEKELSFYCSSEDTMCLDLCGEATMCKVKEETCHNCIGTSITLTYIFNYMGKAYTNTGVETLDGEVLSSLKGSEFVSFSSRSIYNHVDRFNSSSLKRNFRSLCTDGTRYPIVLFKKNRGSQRVADVQFVFCDNGVFEMEFGADVIINMEENKTLF